MLLEWRCSWQRQVLTCLPCWLPCLPAGPGERPDRDAAGAHVAGHAAGALQPAGVMAWRHTLWICSTSTEGNWEYLVTAVGRGHL